MRIILYTKKEIWISIRLGKPMRGSLQVVFEKADRQEFIIVAKREVREKTGLSVT